MIVLVGAVVVMVVVVGGKVVVVLTVLVTVEMPRYEEQNGVADT